MKPYKYISFAYPSSAAARHYGVDKTGGYYVSQQRWQYLPNGNLQYELPEFGSEFAYRKMRDAVAVMASMDGDHAPFHCQTTGMTAEQIDTCAIDYTGRRVRCQPSSAASVASVETAAVTVYEAGDVIDFDHEMQRAAERAAGSR